MISVEQALITVIENSLKPKKVKKPIVDTLGQVLAQDIIAKNDNPPFNNSAMDGYAVRAQDSGKGKTLEIIEELPAGTVAGKEVTQRKASVIMTGAPLPPGADSVIQVELTEKSGNKVILKSAVKKGENVRLAGEDIKTGDKVISRGEVVGPATIGIAASLGYAEIEVYKKPTVSILSTGSELVEPGEDLIEGKIRDSNSSLLAGLCREIGIDAQITGIAKDTKEDTENKLKEALKGDVVLTSGGVSVGEYDFVKDVLEGMGAQRLFWEVAQKPGKPLAFYKIDDKVVFGLPGNPVAVLVCFEAYVRPLLLRSMGFVDIFRPVIRVKAGHGIKKRKRRADWLRVNIKEENEELTAYLTGPQGSGMLTSMLAEGLLFLSADAENINEGDEVEVLLINE